MNNKLGYTSAQVKAFSKKEGEEFRIDRGHKKQETYNDKNTIPEGFGPAQKEKDNEIRRKAGAKKCNAYAQSKTPAEGFLPSQKEYVEFLVRNEMRNQKIQERKAGK